MSATATFASILDWLAERLRDLAQWPIMLVRYLPRRAARLVRTLVAGLRGLAGFLPGLVRASQAGSTSARLRQQGRAAGFWLHTLFSQLFDSAGGPELAQFFMHLVMPTTPLTGDEIASASTVLGPTALRYGDVRIAEGGLLNWIFRYNGNRAFATWHTVHLPATGNHTRANRAILLHELTHIYQYEQIGSRYLGEAIYVQLTLGGTCYEYGYAEGLRSATAEGRRLADYNREQQAQIAQHYFHYLTQGDDVVAYEPFIAELRSGRL